MRAERLFRGLMLAIIVLIILFAMTRPYVRAATGSASWCAPTPDYCHGWGEPAMLGAVPSFQYGDRPYYVRVCRTDADRCTTVKVVSFCDCGIGVIDLSPAAFKDLAPLSVGRVPVTVTRVAASVEIQAAPAEPGVTLPPTDTEP